MSLFFTDFLAFASQSAFFWTIAFSFGLAIGSFLNVLIHRLPKMMEREWAGQCAELSGKEAPALEKYNLAWPPSACPQCAHRIRAHENIPVFSWLFLRAKCSSCANPISWRYPLVELITAALFLACALSFGPGARFFLASFFCAAMVALAFIDFDTFLLPDEITLPLIWVGLLASLTGAGFVDPRGSIIGAAAGYLSLWSVYWGFKIFTGKEGMGYGDFKLFAATGAWFGWQILPGAILCASIGGLLCALPQVFAKKREASQPIPFGPALAFGALICLFFLDAIRRFFLGL